MRMDHGGDIYEMPVRLDFSVSISPSGMPESLKKAVISSSGAWEQYPDIRQRKLKSYAARWYAGHGTPVPEDWFLFGNGASGLLYALMAGLKPAKVLIPVPSFGEYRETAEAAGAEVCRISLPESSDFSLRGGLSEIEKALEAGDIDLMILGNPNNPTGSCITALEAEKLADACRKTGTVLVADECFGWFLPDRVQYSMLPSVLARPDSFSHVIILESLTKICAMPGIRLGYLIAPDSGIRGRIRHVMQPWAVSAPAEAAGCEAFSGCLDICAQNARSILSRERGRLSDALEGLGCRVIPSEVNYILFRCGPEYGDLKKRCLSRGILIRSCSSSDGPGEGYYRVAVKSPQENDELIMTLRKINGEKNYG